MRAGRTARGASAAGRTARGASAGSAAARFAPAHRQRGVALIIALILVALATILATKLTFDGFLERRRTMGVLAAEQALHFGMGAEALAADVLLKDAQNTKQTTLASAWAQPTQPLPITPQEDPDPPQRLP